MMRYKRFLFRLLKDRRDMRWCDNFVSDFEGFATTIALVFKVNTEKVLQTLALKVVYLEDHPELDTEDPQEKLDLMVKRKLEEEARKKPRAELSVEELDKIMSRYEPPPVLKRVEPKPSIPEAKASEELVQTLGTIMEVDYNPGVTAEFLDSLFR
jgi:hypothetical protein